MRNCYHDCDYDWNHNCSHDRDYDYNQDCNQGSIFGQVRAMFLFNQVCLAKRMGTLETHGITRTTLSRTYLSIMAIATSQQQTLKQSSNGVLHLSLARQIWAPLLYWRTFRQRSHGREESVKGTRYRETLSLCVSRTSAMWWRKDSHLHRGRRRRIDWMCHRRKPGNFWTEGGLIPPGHFPFRPDPYSVPSSLLRSQIARLFPSFSSLLADSESGIRAMSRAGVLSEVKVPGPRLLSLRRPISLPRQELLDIPNRPNGTELSRQRQESLFVQSWSSWLHSKRSLRRVHLVVIAVRDFRHGYRLWTLVEGLLWQDRSSRKGSRRSSQSAKSPP